MHSYLMEGLPPPSLTLPLPRSRLKHRNSLLVPFPQLLQYHPHLWQLPLQLLTRILRSSLIKRYIELALRLARFLGRILAHRLRYELYIQGSLAKCSEWVPGPLLEGFKEAGGHLFKKVGEDGVCEGAGGGRDFGVDVDEEKERFVDIGADVVGARSRRHPVWRCYTSVDNIREASCYGLGVGMEESIGDLGEDIADGLALVRERSGEVGFELRD